MTQESVRGGATDFPAFSRRASELSVVLLEGIHDSAVSALDDAGFQNITRLTGALQGDELTAAVSGAHYLGIRSRSQLTPEVLEAAPELRAVGCFCIGTNQVDLQTAARCGVPVFNAPFSNTRSVAELVLAESILLLRDVPRKNAAAHRGEWQKSAVGSNEIRGKRLGIVGYGHIGTQLGLLAEAFGMRVFFYDTATKLALGNAEPVDSLDDLLERVDVVSLHVPETPATRNMLGAEQLKRMRDGAILINASRGTVVDIDALRDALDNDKLRGAAIDVFPEEPRSNTDKFESSLRGFDNVVLTPHVGGSTQEAQERIGVEVADKLIKFHRYGETVSAKNFPEVSLPPHFGTYRLLHIHRNQPGVLAQVNAVFSEGGINIEGEYLQTDAQIGYVVVDFGVEQDFDRSRLDVLKQIDGTLRARIVHR